MRKADKEEITETVNTFLRNYDLNENQLQLNASFTDDLGLDSLDFVELVWTLEEAFDLYIFSDQLSNSLHTINDLINTIEGLLHNSKHYKK